VKIYSAFCPSRPWSVQYATMGKSTSRCMRLSDRCSSYCCFSIQFTTFRSLFSFVRAVWPTTFYRLFPRTKYFYCELSISLKIAHSTFEHDVAVGMFNYKASLIPGSASIAVILCFQKSCTSMCFATHRDPAAYFSRSGQWLIHMFNFWKQADFTS
jgi:hypothetical protein